MAARSEGRAAGDLSMWSHDQSLLVRFPAAGPFFPSPSPPWRCGHSRCTSFVSTKTTMASESPEDAAQRLLAEMRAGGEGTCRLQWGLSPGIPGGILPDASGTTAQTASSDAVVVYAKRQRHHRPSTGSRSPERGANPRPGSAPPGERMGGGRASDARTIGTLRLSDAGTT